MSITDSNPLVVASGNRHKIDEIAAILGDRYQLRAQSDWNLSSAVEDGGTFVENAIIKARHACAGTGLPALADDSGLEVFALGGEPGIYSARYAGEAASDKDNVEKLLAALTTETNRSARFQCVIVMLRHTHDPVPIIAQGSWYGEILSAPRGANGFGYDPVFVPAGASTSAAEMSAADKNRISHRGLALADLAAQLAE